VGGEDNAGDQPVARRAVASSSSSSAWPLQLTHQFLLNIANQKILHPSLRLAYGSIFGALRKTFSILGGLLSQNES
jgi:hypothetical protein